MEAIVRVASEADAAGIAALVNRAYRPAPAQGGWTHESGLVSGARTSEAMVRSFFGPDSDVLVLCRGAEIVACVHVQGGESAACIGMLATEPAAQAAGLGKRMLACAAMAFRMSVLSARTELLAFYERRGYARTGVREAFPLAAGAGQPCVAGLELDILVKMPGV